MFLRKKFFKKVLTGFFTLSMASILIFPQSSAVAAPPVSPYAPGATLSPACLPGSPNCTVAPPALAGANSDITSLSGLTTPLSRSQGGTGLTATGTAYQLLGVNAGATGLEYKTLVAGSGITLTQAANSITIAAMAGAGEANTASNIGTGVGLFKQKSGADLQFKSFVAGSNKITLTSSTNHISVDANEGNFNLNNIGGTLDVAKGGTGTGIAFAQGAVVFADAGGVYNQNNLLVWDNPNQRLGVGINAPLSSLHVEGSVAHAVLTTAADTRLDETHYIVLADSSGGRIFITLPDHKVARGRVYIIKAIKTGGNPVVIQPASGTIDTMADLQLTADFESRQIVSDGSDWWVINSYKP